MRGLAALAVVFEHSLDALLPELRQAVSPSFDFGRYGVFVFFLVSGYVVPASLERRGSVREFWIGRLFRIYPLWAVAAAIGLAFALAEVYWGLNQRLAERPWTSALAHLLMLQDLLQTPNVLNVFWTLSYEMAFYLLVTAMYVAGVHRASAHTALGFGAGAVAVVALAPLFPLALPAGVGTVYAVAALLVAGLAAVLTRDPLLRRGGAAVLAAVPLVLLVLNSRIGAAESLAIVATMFAGTAVYRIERGTLGPWAWWAVGLVPVLSVAAGVLAGRPVGWCAAITAAWLTFGAGRALRGRRLPRLLPWLGLISYSVYLLHQVVLQVIRRMIGDPAALSGWERLGWGVVVLAAVLGVGAASYRLVERPMQDLGRRAARASRRRTGEAGRSPAPGPARPVRAR
ncbi:acyltransferase [Actinomadura craniellae]|uniref:Acyltransferase n=1 Tax=Actinomadura craniellae TaxID=2231787 RepID=A0A365GX20_9ACTN|nr:acyltransferase [Actinomadura craniellae]